MPLVLTDEETHFLLDLLDRTYRDTKYEYADTDDSRWKQHVGHEKALLESITGKLREAAGVRD